MRPTRALKELIFAEFPNDLLDTKCTIRIFQYEGNLETVKETLNLLGTPKSIGGPVIKQITEAHEYVLTLLRAGIRVPSGFVTTYRIPERAIKEAITNAVIHRDYYTKRDIEVRIFEDRIEIESPGLFPFNITPSNIGGNKEAREILHLDDTIKVSRLFNRRVKQGVLTKIEPRTGAKRSVWYRLPNSDEKTLFAWDKSK